MTVSPTVAALFGSVATAIAIFGGGLAVEAFKRRRDRIGMTLALAGAIDAMLALIEARGMVREITEAHDRLAAGTRVDFAALIVDNAPFNAVTLSYRDQLGHLGGTLPFRVARFLVFNDGLLRDLDRLRANTEAPETQASLIRGMEPVWREAQALGAALVVELRRAAGLRDTPTARHGDRGLTRGGIPGDAAGERRGVAGRGTPT